MFVDKNLHKNGDFVIIHDDDNNIKKTPTNHKTKKNKIWCFMKMCPHLSVRLAAFLICLILILIIQCYDFIKYASYSDKIVLISIITYTHIDVEFIKNISNTQIDEQHNLSKYNNDVGIYIITGNITDNSKISGDEYLTGKNYISYNTEINNKHIFIGSHYFISETYHYNDSINVIISNKTNHNVFELLIFKKIDSIKNYKNPSYVRLEKEIQEDIAELEADFQSYRNRAIAMMRTQQMRNIYAAEIGTSFNPKNSYTSMFITQYKSILKKKLMLEKLGEITNIIMIDPNNTKIYMKIEDNWHTTIQKGDCVVNIISIS